MSACPKCSGGNDTALDMTDEPFRAPQDGDVSVCFYCGHITIFEGSGSREPTKAELRMIRNNPTFMEMMRIRTRKAN